ncbi:hypothetical protein FGIG_12370 [Fasciola gigantica]|uniref:Thioredoxin domain-containing protein n=1 Tax=Fasciola gigantica TaxID=46835 RepID=A0A504YTW9_FASGI|nr:hypothetical protein FGIG_12370 [Fasciola gigantica]
MVMDSHRGARGIHLVELLKPYGYEAMCNIDTFILLFCSVGLWLSSIPHIVHSLRMIQDSSTKELFFQQPSSVFNYEDDSYNALLSNQSTKAATLIFLYAKWDADSRQSRSVIEDVNQFSPMEVFALSCWKNPCSTEVEPKRYPELRVHMKDFGHLTYRGHYGSLHISNFVSHVLRPLKFVSSEDELARLLLTHKFTIVSYFGVPSWRSAEQNGFYRAALLFSDPLASKKTLEVSGIDLTKNLIFVVATFRNKATQQKNQSGTQRSVVQKFPLTIYVQCENSIFALLQCYSTIE